MLVWEEPVIWTVTKWLDMIKMFGKVEVQTMLSWISQDGSKLVNTPLNCGEVKAVVMAKLAGKSMEETSPLLR